MPTVVNPGNIVVPLSAILDQLRGRLSSVELDALLAAIIARRKAEVHPGDLITAELMNQILQDLAALNEQVAALTGGTGTGPRNGPATATLYDTATFYGALVKSGEFLPAGTTAEAIQSGTEITTYLQDVSYTALSGTPLGYSGDSTGLLDVFRRLYARQHDVVVLFSAPIPGIPDTTDHKRFAQLLNSILENDTTGGEPSLKKAVDNTNLDGAVKAQNRINNMVRDQGGDVTTGNLEVIYLGAVGGTEDLVIANPAPTTLYRFQVTNRTNRSLDVQFEAKFVDRPTWTNLQVQDLSGAARPSIPLAPFDSSRPNDPAASQEIRVAVKTPAANDGDRGTLQLLAFVPPPVERRESARRELKVATVGTPQTPGAISYTPQSPIISGDLAHVNNGDTVSLEFRFAFAKLTGPASRQFRFRLDISAPSNPDAAFFIEFAPGDVTIDTSPGVSTTNRKVSVPFTMADTAQRLVAVAVTPLSAGTSMTFTATVESLTDGIKTPSPSFTIVVNP